MAQKRLISGEMTIAADGAGLPNVTIVVKGAAIGTATKTDGTYLTAVAANDATLLFSMLGYTTQAIVVDNRNVVHIQLAEGMSQLSESGSECVRVSGTCRLCLVAYTYKYAPYEETDFIPGGIIGRAVLSKENALLPEILREHYTTFLGQNWASTICAEPARNRRNGERDAECGHRITRTVYLQSE